MFSWCGLSNGPPKFSSSTSSRWDICKECLLGAEPSDTLSTCWPPNFTDLVCPSTTKLAPGAEIQPRRSDFSKAVLIFSLQRKLFLHPSPSLVALDLACRLNGAHGLFCTSCWESQDPNSVPSKLAFECSSPQHPQCLAFPSAVSVSLNYLLLTSPFSLFLV